ncbi:catabolite control protein A [Abditibacteriota bacterium]|nr:catabolite control protein A [Abditibacteriota bacterium]
MKTPISTLVPVTARDVARELNLSQPTVSRILSGDVRHRASEETRKRVWETAERLGYRPNAVARSLRHGRTNVIGIHTNHKYDVRNDFLGTIVGALQCACGAYHLDLMLHNSLGSPAETLFDKLRDGRIDGLILHVGTDDPLFEILGTSPLPVVTVADSLPNLPAVMCDDASGMEQLLELLWQRGHRNFAFLAPHIQLPSVERRKKAFESELKRRKVPAHARRVISINYEQASSALEELQQNSPVAVCCWNDRTAYNLLRECLQRGIRVPREIAVTGFDGFRDDQLPARELVTVNCPWENVAEKALEKLVELIDLRQKKQMPPAPEEIRLPVTILDGDTI